MDSWTTRAALGLAATLALATFTERARAEPYFAFRDGYKCSQCHVNMTGGGKRNDFGVLFSQTDLPTSTVSRESLEEITPDSATHWLPESTFFSGRFASWFAMGGNFRVSNTTTAKNIDDHVSNTFRIPEANLYTEVNLLHDYITLYLDAQFAPGGLSSREAFALFKGFLPWGGYIKAGKILLPYGIRVLDDTAFTRSVTGFNYGVSDLGIEAGIEPGPFSLSLAYSNGTGSSSDNNKDKAVTAVCQVVFRHWRLGASINVNRSPNSRRVVFGGFAGLNLGRFTLLGEIDEIVDITENPPGLPPESRVRQLVGLVELDIEIVKGLNLKGQYDFHDPHRRLHDNNRARYSVGLEWFPVQFMQVSVFGRGREEPTQNPTDDERVLEFQIHLFF